MEVQCLFISLYLSIYLPTYLSIYLPIYLSLYLSAYFRPYMWTNIYLLILAESKQSRNKALLLNTES